MAPDTQAPASVSPPLNRRKTDKPRRGRFLGRLGTRAAGIVLLIFAVLVYLAGSSLLLLARQGELIERMGVRDRMAIEAVDEFATDVAEFAQAFAAVMAGALPPTVTATRMVRNAEDILLTFRQLDTLVGDRLNSVVIEGGRDMAARLPDLATRVRDAFAARARGQYGPLQEEWLDIVVAFNTVSARAREIIKADADASLATARDIQQAGQRSILLAAAVGVLGVLLVWVVLVRLTAQPLERLARAMQALARGDAEVRVPEAGRADQVGEMARTVKVFKRNLANTQRLMDQALEGARRTAVVTTQASQAIGQVSDGAMTQLAELRQVSDALSQTAEAIADVGRSTQQARDTAADQLECT